MEGYGIFPEELVEGILSRLPVRQLLRLRCVSKLWCALIDDYRFIEKHHQVQYAKSKEEGDIPFFLDSRSEDPTQFYLLSKKQGDEPLCLTADVYRDIAPYFTDDMSLLDALRCIGVVSGIVGLSWRDVHLGLWNPATRDFKVVPSRPPNYIQRFRGTLGLGLDPKSNDFKIVRSRGSVIGKSNNVRDFAFVFEMYSLSTNSWKSLEEPLHNVFVDFSHTDGYFNGFYYWTARERNRGYPRGVRYRILSFDFSQEVFKLCDPPPPFISSENSLKWRVGQYKEQLALIFSVENIIEQDNGRLYDFEFEIWVACGSDVEDSGMSLLWQHLFTIRPKPDFSIFYHLWANAFRIDGDLLLTIRWEANERYEGSKIECCLYNSSTQTFKRLGLSIACGSCFRYVESLFPLSKRQVRTSE